MFGQVRELIGAANIQNDFPTCQGYPTDRFTVFATQNPSIDRFYVVKTPQLTN